MTTGDPGLDIDQLRALRAPATHLDILRDRIREHLAAHEGYVAFSGGKDSAVVVHLACQVDPAVPIAFFDSGLEFPETYTYLDELQSSWGLNLHVFPARPDALHLLHDAGTWDHNVPTVAQRPKLHQVLISQPSAAAHRRFGDGELWGLRAEESRGRSTHFMRSQASCDCDPPCTPGDLAARHGGRHERVDGTVTYSPVWNWTSAQIWGYLTRHQIPVNPVYARLRALGAPESALRLTAVLDGNGLENGRLTWLRRGWPTLFEELALVLPRIRELA